MRAECRVAAEGILAGRGVGNGVGTGGARRLMGEGVLAGVEEGRGDSVGSKERGTDVSWPEFG